MKTAPCPYCKEELDFMSKKECPRCHEPIVASLTIYPEHRMGWAKPTVMCLYCGQVPARCKCENPQWNIDQKEMRK